MHAPTILLIEDSQEYTEIISQYLTDEGYSVTTAPTPHDAFQLLEFTPADLIICDLHLPFALDERIKDYPYSVEVGVRTIEELKVVFPEKAFLAVTASMASDAVSTDRLRELVPVLNKPFAKEALLEVVEGLIGAADSHNHIMM